MFCIWEFPINSPTGESVGEACYVLYLCRRDLAVVWLSLTRLADATSAVVARAVAPAIGQDGPRKI